MEYNKKINPSIPGRGEGQGVSGRKPFKYWDLVVYYLMFLDFSTSSSQNTG